MLEIWFIDKPTQAVNHGGLTAGDFSFYNPVVESNENVTKKSPRNRGRLKKHGGPVFVATADKKV